VDASPTEEATPKEGTDSQDVSSEKVLVSIVETDGKRDLCRSSLLLLLDLELDRTLGNRASIEFTGVGEDNGATLSFSVVGESGGCCCDDVACSGMDGGSSIVDSGAAFNFALIPPPLSATPRLFRTRPFFFFFRFSGGAGGCFDFGGSPFVFRDSVLCMIQIKANRAAKVAAAAAVGITP
jgi:hypothetical protein